MSKKINRKNSSGFSTGHSDPADECGISAQNSGFSVDGGTGGCHSNTQSEGSGFVSESNQSGFECNLESPTDSGFGTDDDVTLLDNDFKKQIFVNVKPLTSQGGMAQVLRAKWLCNGHKDGATHEVVIKRLPQEHRRGSPEYKFFKNEFYIAKLVNSPHVIKVLGQGEDGSGCYYWMDFCNGLPLHDLLTKAPFSDSEAQLIGAGILKGLNALHIEGVCHRDLKPENILVKGSGNFVVLIDLGLATRENIHDIEGLKHIGTMKYAAPEQRDGRIHLIDNRSDIYSFGLILLEMLTGSLDESSLAEQLKQPFRNIIQKCLSTDPKDRFASAEEILTIFQKRTPNQSDIEEIENLIKESFLDDLKLDDEEKAKIRDRAIDLGIGEERFEGLISLVSIKIKEFNEEITESALEGVTSKLKLLANNLEVTEEKYLSFITIRKEDINKLRCEDIFNYVKGRKGVEDLSAIKEKSTKLYINEEQFCKIVNKVKDYPAFFSEINNKLTKLSDCDDVEIIKKISTKAEEFGIDKLKLDAKIKEIRSWRQREEDAKKYGMKAVKVSTDVLRSIATRAAREKRKIIIFTLLVFCLVVGLRFFPEKMPTPHTPPKPVETFTPTADNINIREAPNTSSKKIGLVNKGSLLRVIERNGYWLHLERGGWVHAGYMRSIDSNKPLQTQIKQPVPTNKIIKKVSSTEKSKPDIALSISQPPDANTLITVDTLNLPNGNRYEGENRGGIPHGLGTLFFADGSRYVGQFENGIKIPGQGELHLKDN